MEVFGVAELVTKYKTISSSLSSVLARFLREDADKEIGDSIVTNFSTESSEEGKWKNLALRTIFEREAKGFSGRHPILYRTGDLMREALGEKTGSKRVVKYDSNGASLLVRIYSKKALELYNTTQPHRDFMSFRKKNRENIRRGLSETIFNLLQSK